MQFTLFTVILLAIYYLAGRLKPAFQWSVLLCGSMVFYAFSGWQHLFYILSASLITWGGAMLIKRFPRYRKLLFTAGLLSIFGILAYVKYWRALFRPDAGLLLPLGISFFTFQAAGYLIDIYMGKYDPQPNFFRYLLFISFFPQLIQGPIGRYNQLEAELYTPKRSLSSADAGRALRQILFGLLKKYALANMLSDTVSYILDLPAVTGASASTGTAAIGTLSTYTPGSLIVVGILLYSVQQYADFSGGIDMVIGIARLFGITLTPNFRQPYFATSLSDFWRRWHISLGTWMKDYVFYPFALLTPMQKLGKTVKKHWGRHLGRSIVPCIANILVFALVGIWHGAQLHYLYWGLYNGLVIAGSDLLSPVFSQISKTLHLPVKSKGFHVVRIVRTFLIVNLGWYLDRIVSMKGLGTALHNTIFRFRMGELHAEWETLLQQLFVKESLNRYAFHVAGAALILVVLNSLICEAERSRRKTPRSADADPVPLFHSVLLSVVAAVLILLSFTLVSAKGGFLYANF